MIRKYLCGLGALGASMAAATAAWAQEAAPAAAAAVPNPGNNAWMMTATALVNADDRIYAIATTERVEKNRRPAAMQNGGTQ